MYGCHFDKKTKEPVCKINVTKQIEAVVDEYVGQSVNRTIQVLILCERARAHVNKFPGQQTRIYDRLAMEIRMASALYS